MGRVLGLGIEKDLEYDLEMGVGLARACERLSVIWRWGVELGRAIEILSVIWRWGVG